MAGKWKILYEGVRGASISCIIHIHKIKHGRNYIFLLIMDILLNAKDGGWVAVEGGGGCAGRNVMTQENGSRTERFGKRLPQGLHCFQRSNWPGRWCSREEGEPTIQEAHSIGYAMARFFCWSTWSLFASYTIFHGMNQKNGGRTWVEDADADAAVHFPLSSVVNRLSILIKAKHTANAFILYSLYL